MPRSQTVNFPLPFRTRLTGWVLSSLRNVANRRRERLLLARLDQRLIRDIGLEPDAVRDECEKPFWRA